MAERVQSLNNIAKTIDTVSSIYLVSFGLISNVISFIIYKRKVFSKQSIGTYLSWLSISNLIAVLTLLENLFIKFEWNKTLVYCKFYVYLHYINLQYCSFDHLLSVTMAFKYKIKVLKEKYYQIIVLLCILALLCLINIPLLINSYYNEEISECDLYPKYNYMLDILDMLVCTLIPFILMTISTAIIIVRLFEWKNDTRTINRARSSESSRNKIRKTQFARTVIGINLLFLVCNLPISIILIVMNYKGSTSSDDKSNSVKTFDEQLANAQLELFYSIFHMLMYSHNASPLIVYLICNRLFRQEFYILFCIHNKDNNEAIRGKKQRKQRLTTNNY